MYKKIKKRILSSIPDYLRHHIVRKNLRIDYELPREYSFKLASSEDDFQAVGELVYKRYIDVNLQDKSDVKSRLSMYQALPNTAVLMMLKSEKLVGTVSLIGDSNLGLPSEKIADIDLLKKKRRCCEVSALAICSEEKGKYLLYLFKYLYEIAKNVMRVEYLIISTTQKSLSSKLIYNSLLFFEDINESNNIKYEDANGQQCQTQVLDLSAAKNIYKQMYINKKKENNLYYFFIKHVVQQFNIDYKKDIPNPITLEAAFEKVLTNKFVQKQLSQDVITKIMSLYNGSPFEQRIKEYLTSDIPNFSKRGNYRLPCYDECMLFYKDSYHRCNIINTSEEGLQIKLKKDVKDISTDQKLKLLWLKDDDTYAFKNIIIVWKNEFSLGVKYSY